MYEVNKMIEEIIPKKTNVTNKEQLIIITFKIN